MNLSTLLNDENEDVNKPSRRPSWVLSRQNPLPALRTDSYRSPGGPPSRQSSFESQNPALLHSPAIQRLTRPEHAYQNQYSPGGTAQYPPNNTPLSPYATSSISPGNQHPHGNRPSSHPSVPSTPSSTHVQTPHTYHESPSTSYPYPNPAQAYTHPQGSQPGTPLGPPNGPFRLPSHSSRESPSILNVLHSPSGGVHANAIGTYKPSPQSSISHIVNAPTNYYQAPIHTSAPEKASSSDPDDRERSVSVSPKTVVTALPPRLNSLPPRGHAHESSSSPIKDQRGRTQLGPADSLRFGEQDRYRNASLEGPLGPMAPQSGFLMDPLQQRHTFPDTPDMAKKKDLSDPSNRTTLAKTDVSVAPNVTPTVKTTVSSPAIYPNNQRLKAEEGGQQSSPILIESPKSIPQTVAPPTTTSLKRSHEPEVVKDSAGYSPPSKRRRFAEIPIWAQRCKHTTPLAKYRHLNSTNGATHARAKQLESRAGEPKAQMIPVVKHENSNLEIWESNFTNTPVYDEITRQLCDWLYKSVVVNQSLQTGSADGMPSTDGLLEIEAKLGTLVDNHKDRMGLPVETETVVSEGMNVGFESMMTVEQHKTFNAKLNEAFQKSRGPPDPKPRMPMSYSHTNERDSFFELPSSEVANLPAALKTLINPRKPPKLRITRDLKTGKVTAQIIKIRIADLHVYSPRTPFDWRVSVSAEVNWLGDGRGLMANAPQDTLRNNTPDRFKDRVSYKHQHCQIDLTQVKPSTAVHVENATHELEVELDATVVRREGLLAQRGQPNRYEELVRVFTDNVRTLARLMS